MPRNAPDDDLNDMIRFGSDEPPDMMCPSCRATVSEDTQKCPHCGDWITPVDPNGAGIRRWMFIIAAIIMLLIALRMAF